MHMMQEEILTAADIKDSNAIQAICTLVIEVQDDVRIDFYLFDAGQRRACSVNRSNHSLITTKQVAACIILCGIKWSEEQDCQRVCGCVGGSS